ncbi:MAG TPA: hypothetical protein VF832_02945 [Longimicrobiales bacterium]
MFRDLVGHDRDPELARRARLRFLALRPLLRVLRHGAEGISNDSFEKQLEGIREELGSLPARDPERVRLSRYLHQITSRLPEDLTAAAAGLGDVAEQAGYVSAAEEFFRTAFELADRSQLPARAAAALWRLGMLCHRLGRDEEATRHLSAAAAAAELAGASAEWAQATCDGALLRAATGDPAARAALQQVLARGQELGDPEVRGVAALALADLALLEGDAESALEASWSALEGTAGQRSPLVLARAAAALRGLGLFDPALQSFDAALEDGLPPEERWTTRAERVATFAEAGRKQEFAVARDELLQAARAEALPPRAAALLHLSLARACLVLESPDFARDHLRDGLEAARSGACADVIPQLEALLPCLEQAPAPRRTARRPEPGARARAIAEAMGALLTPVPT